MSTLAGTTCLVTGASSGIGAEIARELAKRGATRIVLVARSADRLEALASELGSVAVPHVADLTQDADIHTLLETHPETTVLINNAGVGINKGFSDAPCEELEKMVDLNCKAMVTLTHHYLTGMRRQKRGWIMNVGSTAGDVPMPTMSVYSATKAFVKFFTEGLRIEMTGSDIVVHLLAPGPVNTESFTRSRPWKTPDAAPYPSVFLDPDRVAKEALDAMEADRPRSTPSLPVRLMFSMAGLIPLTVIRPLLGTGARQLRRSQPD